MIRFVVLVSWLTACGGTMHPSAPTTAPSVAELTAALHIATPTDAMATSIELDGAPPHEALLTGHDPTQASAWIFRTTDTGWSVVAVESIPLDDPGTFEATPGATTLHVLSTGDGRDIPFVRFENAQGGHDPRTFVVDVVALTLRGDAIEHAWRCRTTDLEESGPERETVHDVERTIAFDDVAHTIEVSEPGARVVYAYADGRWTAAPVDPCAP